VLRDGAWAEKGNRLWRVLRCKVRMKDLLVGRELLVELRQSHQGKMIVRRAMEPGDVVVE
jgi:hypothetical protein